MRALAVLVLSSSAAFAEQPRGTYTLDRGEASVITDGKRRRHPSCGGEKVFGGQATFVVEYGDTILVNGRAWRFKGHTVHPDEKEPGPDAFVIVGDPDSKDTISIWFGKVPGSAAGSLHVSGSRDGKYCVDGWRLNGKYSSRLPKR